MPNPVPEISAVAAEWAWSALERPASDSELRRHETQTELASASRIAIPEQLSTSIAEINQPISAVVMNAEAALHLLLAQPMDTEAVRRLLVCIVHDGMHAGDIVNRTCGCRRSARPVR
jgi:C4-dicarboxylate-specific signal transduction histidine kinase